MKIKLSKKLIIILISILFLVGMGRVLKVKGYIPKDFFYQSLVKLHITKPCYNSYKNMIEIFSQEGFDYKKTNEAIVNSSLKKLLDKNIADEPKIPTITHKVYLVSKQNPSSLNDFYIEELKANINKLNSLDQNWQHNIWTNDPDIFPDEIKSLRAVQIRPVEDLKDSPLFEVLLEIIAKGQTVKPHLAEAADLVRLMAVQKFGGVYSDLDYEIYNPAALLELMKKFDFIGGREKQNEFSYYGNAFIAAKPNHPILNEALRRNVRNRSSGSEVPFYIQYPCNGYDELYFNGPPLLTISYFSKNNIDGNSDIILPPWMIFNLNFARFKNSISYADESDANLGFIQKIKKIFKIGSEKDINRVCDYSIIRKDDFDLNNKRMNQLIADFTKNITMEDIQLYYELSEYNQSKENKNNIYYNIENRGNFDIIGADMFCGSWTFGGKVFRRNYYWNWLSSGVSNK